MEIEAKFVVPNRQTYRSLLRLRDTAGYVLIPTSAVQMADRYFDTADGRLLAAGYACRLRTENASVLATLKGLGGALGAIHHRDEQEIQLAMWTPDAIAWPASPARDLALKLSGGAPLQPLFDLEQHRTRSDVMDGVRCVAELSLDAVRVVVGQRPALYYELEVELKAEGTEADLARIAQALVDEHGLAAEPRSKFERALETLRVRGAAVEGRLSAQERSALAAHAAGPDGELARRALVVLGWADGLPTREIVVRSGLSDGRVRFWLRAFRAERMRIFAASEAAPALDKSAPRGRPARRASRAAAPAPAEVAGAVPQGRLAEAPMPAAPVAPPAETPRPSPVAQPRQPIVRRSPLAVAEFCRAHGVDMVHAAYVADQAAFLFDALARVHGLPRKRRKLLRQAALLCTVGARQDPARSQRAGRDLILAEPLREVSTGDRLLLASVVALQRAKPKPDKETTMAALEPKQRELAISLAALLTVAEALDSSRSQATRFESVEGTGSVHCQLVLAGPAADVDARQAAAAGAWWQRLYKQELVFTALPAPASAVVQDAGEAAEAGTAAQPLAPAPVEIPPLRGDEPMSEAGRKVLYTHFLRMLANEAGTRLGDDIEALHDMRVATRRMRAAYRIFEAYFEPKPVKPFNKSLRRVGAALGAVRDLDVLLEKAEAYQAAAAGALPAGDTAPSAATEPATEPAAEAPTDAAGSTVLTETVAGPVGGSAEAPALAPLLADWHARRELARREMLDTLDSGAYARFVAEFQTFLTTPGAGARQVPPGEPVPYQVRHVLPRLIFERYETVRAYEPVLRDGAPLTTYHLLRIDFKRLRYLLEFTREVLGPGAPELIRQVTVLQDLLGALHDAYVAEELIGTFLDEQRSKRKKAQPPVSLAGVERYLDVQVAVQEELLAQFPAPWTEVLSADFRRSLALAVAVL